MILKKNQTNELLNYFFGFVNQNIDKVNFDDLPIVAMGYVRFAFHDAGKSGFSKYKPKYDLLSEASFESSEIELKKTKSFLKKVQTNLHKILNDLIEQRLPELLKQKGVRCISIVDDKFVERFETKKVPIDKLELGVEKQKTEAAFADILLNGNLIPSHFKRCNNCNNYFYQQTKRKQDYCSNNCSSANRQRDYQKRIKKNKK